LSLPYYNQWKNTFSTEEWKEIIEKEIDAIIDKVNQASKKYVLYDFRRLNSTLLYNLAPIYVQENYLDRLFELVQKEQNLDNILTYFSNLKNQYSIEIIELLVPLFEKQGERSEGRSQYKYLAQKMQFIINDLPESKEKILAVAQKLKAKYPRRPAMIEELEKLF
jgi:BioD-like phosphotransacetylase family protein